MNSRAKLLSLTLALGTSLSLAAVAPIGQVAASAPAADPIVATGVLPDGFAVGDVEAELAPATTDATPVGAELPTFFIDRSNISLGAGRQLVIRLAPSHVPAAFRRPNGIVDVQIHAGNDTKSWYTTLSAQSVTTPATAKRAAARTIAEPARWVDPQALRAAASSSPTSAVTFARKTATVTRAGALSSKVDALTPPAFASATGKPAASSRAVTGDSDSEWDSGAVTPRAATAKCPSGGEGPHQTKKLSNVLAWSTIGTTYPVGKSTAWMTVKTDKENGAKYGGAVKFGGVNASFAGSSFASGGWSKTWTRSTALRSYRKQVEYRRVKYYNYLAGPACDHVHWIAYKETAGTDENTQGINWPDWKKCVKAAPGPFSRDSAEGKSYEFGAAVKLKDVIGVDLGISRKYMRSQAVNYNVVGKKVLCGNNDWPSLSGKLRERYYAAKWLP